MTDDDAVHEFAGRGMGYYIAARSSFLAQQVPVCGILYHHAIEMLLNHRDLVIQDSETAGAALDLFRSKPKLGFSDCLLLQIARSAGHVPFGTLDRNLANVDGVILV